MHLAAATAWAQVRVTRSDAERAALSAGTRVALARADTAAALARVLSARTLPNPTLSASYTKSAPTRHLTVDVPVFDALRTRGTRVGQATAASRAARLLYASERIAAQVEVDTTYTSALAARARFRLSRQSALDADSLRLMSVRRRDAGDAADLDVDLATVVAGQQMNVAASDSMTYMSALLTVQTLMGLPADSVSIELADSLVRAPSDTPVAAGSVGAAIAAPGVLAAEATLAAADIAVLVQRRATFALPSLTVGVEFGDDTEPGLLPVIGVAIPLPFFDRNKGPVAEAQAERERARVQVVAARLEARRRLVEGTRERQALIAKLARDSALVILADRLSQRSLTAYREGAQGLPAVLEARRSALDVLAQYIDDLAALLIVQSELRALTRTVVVP
jgi:cobalt-zinc-cadmium efflux system outer membrane protein